MRGHVAAIASGLAAWAALPLAAGCTRQGTQILQEAGDGTPSGQMAAPEEPTQPTVAPAEPAPAAAPTPTQGQPPGAPSQPAAPEGGGTSSQRQGKDPAQIFGGTNTGANDSQLRNLQRLHPDGGAHGGSQTP